LNESAPRLNWQIARVSATRAETPRVCTLVLELPQWRGHHAGQHVDVRLTAPDGYQAERSYSIASAPRAGQIELTVERLDDGEVSPYLTGVAREGDQIELRGPIGGYFVWEPRIPRPLALIAGGSGVAPLMAMLRARAAAGLVNHQALLLFSARDGEELIYRKELDALAANDRSLRIAYTLTRAQPPGWPGYSRRIDREMLAEALSALDPAPVMYVCGPTPMVELTATLLVELGHAPDDILTERFGPTGEG
jgi:ferredoxin-NADP reductase